eukprot:4476811-Pyramimonas_sp.AAC.1
MACAADHVLGLSVQMTKLDVLGGLLPHPLTLGMPCTVCKEPAQGLWIISGVEPCSLELGRELIVVWVEDDDVWI